MSFKKEKISDLLKALSIDMHAMDVDSKIVTAIRSFALFKAADESSNPRFIAEQELKQAQEIVINVGEQYYDDEARWKKAKDHMIELLDLLNAGNFSRLVSRINYMLTDSYLTGEYFRGDDPREVDLDGSVLDGDWYSPGYGESTKEWIAHMKNALDAIKKLGSGTGTVESAKFAHGQVYKDLITWTNTLSDEVGEPAVKALSKMEGWQYYMRMRKAIEAGTATQEQIDSATKAGRDALNQVKNTTAGN